MSSGTYGIFRNGEEQVYNAPRAAELQESSGGPYNAIMLLVDDTLVSFRGGATADPSEEGYMPYVAPDRPSLSWAYAETDLTKDGSGDDSWIATTTLGADIDLDGSIDDTLIVTTEYESPNAYADLTYTLVKGPASARSYQIYHGVDMYLDGNDFGPGTTDVVDGRRLVVQYNESGVGGFRQGQANDDTFTSYVEAYYRCPFGFGDEDCPRSPYGPWDGTPYPDLVDPNESTDAGVGVHWDLGSTETVTTAQFYFAARPPVLTGAFSPTTVDPGGASTLTFTIANPVATGATGLGFTLRLPGGVPISGTPTSTCGVTPTTGSVGDDSTLTMPSFGVGGAASCTVTIPVTLPSSLTGDVYTVSNAALTSVSGDLLSSLDASIVVTGKRYPGSGPYVINDAGGDVGTGLRIAYGAGQVQIQRNGVGQLYEPGTQPDSYIQPDLFNGYFLLVDDTLVTTQSAWPDDDTGWIAYSPVEAIVNWDSITASGGSASGSGTITSALRYTPAGTDDTYTLNVTLDYDAAIPGQVRETLELTVPADHPASGAPVKLYRGLDTYLNGSDFGSGFIDDSTGGSPGIVGALSLDGGVRQYLDHVTGNRWDGWYADTFACPVNPDYADAVFGSCLTLDDSTPNSIVAGGDLWNDTTAVSDDSLTDMALAVMWDVDDTTGTYTYEYDIVFADGPNVPTWVTTSLPSMQVGAPLDTTLVAQANPSPPREIRTYEIVEGSLPAGLTLDKSTGEITGTPTSAGPYSVTMEAVDTRGAVAFRTFSGTVQPPAAIPPGPPRNVTGEPGNGRVTVSWDPPANPGSFPITSYRVTAEPGGASCLVSAPTTTCVITGLTNGTPYTFTVEALNGAGWGAPGVSDPVTPVGPTPPAPEPPGPVRNLQVVKVTAGGTAVIRWRVPLDGGGAPVTRYRVGYRLVTSQKYTRVRPDATTTRIRIRGLEPGRKYWVRVRAANIAGEGPGRRTERFLIP